MSHRQDLYNHTVASLRYGATQEELSEKLNQVVNACRETGKMGEINLKIKVKPVGDGQYELIDSITHKLPEMPKSPTLMFGTPDGNLERDNPRQRNMELRSADEDAKGEEFKEASA